MRAHIRTLVFLSAAILATMLASAAGRAEEAGDRRHAVTFFGAWLTDNSWKEIAALDGVAMRDSGLAGGALSREIAGTRNWALEIEGQAVKHFGEQSHWEFNLPLFARWRTFPWNDRVPTSLAFGIGPSYATELPPAEVELDGDSARFLLYWTAELEIGLPDSPWSGIARLHHRSSGYGVFADAGGSNALAFGIRRRF